MIYYTKDSDLSSGHARWFFCAFPVGACVGFRSPGPVGACVDFEFLTAGTSPRGDSVFELRCTLPGETELGSAEVQPNKG